MKRYIFIILVFLAAYSAFAQDKSVTMKMDILYLTGTSTDNLKANDRNRKTDSLNTGADSFGYNNLVPVFDATFTLSAETKAYIKTPLRSSSPRVQAGFKSKADLSDYDLYAYTNIGSKVWENPYDTANERIITSRRGNGAGFELKKIMGSKFLYGLEYERSYVRDDVVGDLFPKMKRDGFLLREHIGYQHALSKTFFLTPKIKYEYADFDGDAQSYDKYAIALEGYHIYKTVQTAFGISAGTKKNKSENPIFGQTQKDKEYSAFILTGHDKTPHLEFMSSKIFLMHKINKSNIAFYEHKDTMFGVMFGIKF